MNGLIQSILYVNVLKYRFWFIFYFFYKQTNF